MPKPNYEFQKRQRELAKKQKKEAKLREKEAAKAAAQPADGDPDAPPPDETPQTGNG